MIAQVKIFSICALLVSMLLATPAQALTISYSFDVPVNGGPAVTVAMLSLTQNGNDVNFDLFRPSGIDGLDGLSVSKLYFAYSGQYPLDQNPFQVLPGSTMISNFNGHAYTGEAGYRSPLEITMPIPGNSDQFSSAEHVLWGIKNVSVEDFNLPIHPDSKNKQDTFALLKYQGLWGSDNNQFVEAAFKYITSLGCVTPVPEPNSLALLLTGIGLLGLRLRRR